MWLIAVALALVFTGSTLAGLFVARILAGLAIGLRNLAR
jgi:hypothetical protein